MKLNISAYCNEKLIKEQDLELKENATFNYNSRIFGDGWIKVVKVEDGKYTIETSSPFCLERYGFINLFKYKKKYRLSSKKKRTLALPIMDMSFAIILRPVND